MTWTQIFARAFAGEHALQVHLSGEDGMFIVGLDDQKEGDLTDEEAREWIAERLLK